MTQNLYESLDLNTVRYAKLWESVGYSITEAELTIDQINNLFAQVQKTASEQGEDKTVIAKGIDLKNKVSAAFDKIKSEIANTEEMKNFEAEYKQLANELKSAIDNDPRVSKYINAFGKFAQQYPTAQKAVYSTLVAAVGLTVGISGVATAGATAAAAFALMKLVDKLIDRTTSTSVNWKNFKSGTSAKPESDVTDAYTKLKKMASDGDITNLKTYQDAVDNIVKHLNDPKSSKNKLDLLLKNEVKKAVGKIPSSEILLIKRWIELNGGTPDIGLTETQVTEMFNLVEASFADYAKKAGEFAKDKLSQLGTELTTKFTNRKLQKAWADAGHPTDSVEIYDVLVDAGVPKSIIDTVFSELSIEKPESVTTINTGNTALDAKVNEILKTQGKDAAVAYLKQLQAKEVALAKDPYAKSKGDMKRAKGVQPSKNLSTLEANKLKMELQQALPKIKSGDKLAAATIATKIVNYANAGFNVKAEIAKWFQADAVSQKRPKLPESEGFLEAHEYKAFTTILRENDLDWQDLGLLTTLDPAHKTGVFIKLMGN